MVSLNIKISEETREKLRERAADAGHASMESYVEAMVRADAEMDDFGAPEHLCPKNREELERSLLENLHSPKFSPTRTDWQEMQQRVERVAGRRVH